MRKLHCFLVILVFINQIENVKINVEGTVSLGKEVMDTLSQFLGSSYLSGRRSLNPAFEDSSKSIVRSAALCRNLAFCEQLINYIEEFLTVLSMSLKTILDQMLEENFNEIAFEQKFKHYLEITRSILGNANSKVTEDKEAYYWVDTIKKICARFREMVSLIVMEELEANSKKLDKITDELNRKLLITTVLVELKYQTVLCEKFNICIKSYVVTKSLNTLLEKIITLPDDKVGLFMRYFSESIVDTNFYKHLGEQTALEFQVILNDMTYSSEVPSKKLLLTVQKIVEARLDAIKSNSELKMTHDALLVHVILSDMDHIYSVHEYDRYKQIIDNDWLASDVEIGKVVFQVVKDIEAELKNVPDDLLIKLINEVKVFLEVTIDTENNSNKLK